MDISQYITMFLDEAGEYLQSVSEDLLILEKEPKNEEVLNRIFRAIHSLKGMAATMGFEVFSGITHEVENLRSRIREGQLSIESHIIDLLFESHDALSRLLREISEQGSELMKSGNLLERIKEQYSALPATTTEKGMEKKELAFDSAEKNYILKELETGKIFYHIKVILEPDCLLKSVRAFMVLRALKEKGNIIKTVPVLSDIEDENFEDSFELMLISESEKGLIKEELLNIIDIKEVEIGTVDEEIFHVTETITKAPTPLYEFKASQTVRVDIEKLDVLLNMVGELLIIKNRFEGMIERYSADSELKGILNQLNNLTDDMHFSVMQVRMVPVSRIFNALPRMIRDLSKELDKNVNFDMAGAETELDRSIIDALGDPLIHILRNALSHGIEEEKIRISSGKSPVGNISVRAYQKGNEVVIEVEDDGQGIDVDKIANEAIKKGIIRFDEVDSLSKSDIINLIFHPGFSTATITSAVSGRGVGMDAVREVINSLEGTVEVLSEKGQGTIVRLILPLTLSITLSLLMRVGKEIYALPLTLVEEIEIRQLHELQRLREQNVLMLDGRLVPLIWGANLLKTPNYDFNTNREVFILIIKQTGRSVGLIVDEVITEREIVVKPLQGFMKEIPLFTGATILGDGNIVLILDVRNIA